MTGRVREDEQGPAGGLPAWPFRLALLAAVCAASYFAFTPVVYEGVDRVWDKLQHFAAFYVLALLLDFSLPGTRFGARKFLLVLAYGAAIEAVQYFLPYRDASWRDLFADAIGAAAYVLSVPLLARVPPLSARWRAVR